MPTSSDASTQSVLAKLLEEHGLTGDSRLFREAERSALVATDTPGRYMVSANAHPGESVIDVYGPGYVVQAEEVERAWYFTLPKSSIEVREVT